MNNQNIHIQKIENANMKKNAMQMVYSCGQNIIKTNVLTATIPLKLAQLHENCSYHIHDLEFYKSTYNCLGLSISDMVGGKNIGFAHMLRQLFRGIVDLTNRQSGGIGFINFDEDASHFVGEETREEMVVLLNEFFNDLNSLSRKGCEAPYVTLNIGLSTSEKGRKVSSAILDAFIEGDAERKPFIFPNLVFKLKKGVNMVIDDCNYDLLQKAYRVTAKHMIPTYFNTDSSYNKTFDAKSLGIMGCRTRVASNVSGDKDGALNRGNIASLTINLPQIAYKSHKNLTSFYLELDELLDSAKELLLHRYTTLAESATLQWLAEKKYYLGHCKFLDTLDNTDMLRNGTLAIGFIGLWDAVGIINDGINGIEDIEKHYEEGLEIVKHIREYTDKLTKETGLNFSVLATAAEGTTGRFAKYDQTHMGEGHIECQKGFYSNSFHVPVELSIPYWKKCEIEGPFHALCNGGAITYMEFSEMPYHNVLAVQMAIEKAYKEDCGYIGINFPLDICSCCGYRGRLTDICPKCSSKKIDRYRRVSGYLAEEKTFADGKKAEVQRRRSHF
ncbi:anaerobic ribonucleoside-triphosphate reductase [Butyrivibrio sp. TB]|uniref:anaerobic ribonucleoside-triphosphate reductase n=1 Tax=Butyrivibrio sp. TB TaxID=1520809 RepID=UPI0008ADD2CF|nr:anaerobic ribonucleoside-triphosphate reductase [Butyrivibrio sp. TB]SEQ56534.1 ribonucleoside-triphosphate reductase class III catalytic subunit [Butyrivibrio sp. TB]